MTKPDQINAQLDKIWEIIDDTTKSRKVEVVIKRLIATECAKARIDEYENHFPHRKFKKTVWAVTELDIKERIAELQRLAGGED